MANPFVHVELATTDIDKAKAFYRSLFEWQLNDIEMGGGMMKHPMPGAPSQWLPYVGVSNVRAATDKAKSLGASVVRDVTPVMDAGSLSIIADPTGAVLGLWEPKAK